MTAGVYAELTADGKNIVLAFAADEYELDRAAKALKKLTALTEKTDPPSGMRTIACTWANVVQLAFTFNNEMTGRWLPQERLKAWIYQEFLRRNAAPEAVVPSPPGMTPRPYQLDAAVMISRTGKFLLFDDPGVGKTVSALLGLRARQLTHEIFPMVIVVPSWDVADVWTRHIAAWAPAWGEALTYSGPGRTLAAPHGHAAYITTYATATLDAADAKAPLVKLRAKTVVCDEAHYLKNEKAKRTSAIQRIASRANTVIALTGTPVTRDTGDIYPVLAAMDPASWPNRKRFTERYCDTTDNGYGEEIDGLKVLAEPEFRAVLQGQYRRVSKADVLPQLPPKIYSVRRVELPGEWRKAYDQMQEDMLAELPDDGGEIPVMSVLAQLTRLGQLASSACDVDIRVELDDDGNEVKKYDVSLRSPSWKADALLGILAERPGQQTAVFANSKQLIMIAEQACTEAGYTCGLITGGQAKKARQQDIAAFQAGELNVILCTAGAGALGITLTRAGTVVALQRSWQLDQAVQIEDRAHRLDDIVLEHDCLEIIDVVARDTVEERVRTLLRSKGAQLGQLVQDPRIVRELLGGLH